MKEIKFVKSNFNTAALHSVYYIETPIGYFPIVNGHGYTEKGIIHLINYCKEKNDMLQ